MGGRWREGGFQSWRDGFDLDLFIFGLLKNNNLLFSLGVPPDFCTWDYPQCTNRYALIFLETQLQTDKFTPSWEGSARYHE